MAAMSPSRLGFALVFVLLVLQNVNAIDKCRSGCQGPSQTFKYVEGTTYKYNLDSKIEISLASAEGQVTSTEVKAQVLLTQQPNCDQVLRLQNVQIFGADGKKHGNIPDVEKPIKLNFHDGHVEDQICTEQGDTQNSLNIKRAVASLFQADLKKTHETDIFGLCPTEIVTHKNADGIVIEKFRNLNKCAFRENVKQDYFAPVFNLDSEIKTSPILTADFTASQNVKDGVLEQTTVTEQYLFVPFSSGEKGARATVTTKLHLIGTSKDNPTVNANKPKSIIFENPHPVLSPNNNVNSILSAVKEAVQTFGDSVSDNSAREFINLIKTLRVSGKDDLLAVYNQVSSGAGFADKVAAKKVFLDALIRSLSGDSIEVAIVLIKNKELTPIEEKLVYVGLAFARHVSENALGAAAAVLSKPNLPREAYLGIGSLIHRYCQQHSCNDVEQINQISQKLIGKLGNGHPKTPQEEVDYIAILKALGNSKYLNEAVVVKLASIAQDKKAAAKVRVAALEAFQGDACKDKVRESATAVLKDIQQDSEIRIKAYLVLAQCPNAKVGNAIKNLLEKEPSYQVGGFIVSHIKNIRASANPDKHLAKVHLGPLKLPNHYPIDPRKYSFSGEFSYAIDSLGVGNSIEGNVIYSQDSFVPRSACLNLTSEIFGHTMNLVELDVRQERLDNLVKEWLRPNGILEKLTPQVVYDWLKEEKKTVSDTYWQRFNKIINGVRAKRDVSKGEITSINKHILRKNQEPEDQFDLDLAVKLFGSEMGFINLNNDHLKYLDPVAIINFFADKADEGVAKIKNFEEAHRSNVFFLDLELAYPTSLGFPLRLAVEGSSTVQVKTSGSIDFNAFRDVKQQSIAKLSLIPSANIEVSGRLTLDAHVIENGLKVISTLYTATGGDIVIDRFAYNKGLNVKFKFPLEKQTLISATHNIVLHTRELGVAESNAPLKFAQNKDFSVCLDQLSPYVGLTFCADYNGPNVSGKKVPVLPFPFSGDAKVKVAIQRDDVSVYHYHQDNFNEPGKFGAIFKLEVLDKASKPKVSLDLEAFLAPEIYLKGTMTSPVISVVAEGRIVATKNEKAVTARFKYGPNEYYGKAGLVILESGPKSVYRPVLEYKTPQDNEIKSSPYRLDGQVVVEGTMFTIENIQIIIPDKKTITVNGHFGKDPNKPEFNCDVTVSNGDQSGSFKGRVMFDDRNLKLDAEFQNTIRPTINFHLKHDLKVDRVEGEYEVTLQFVHGKDLSSKTHIIDFSSKYTNRVNNKDDYKVALKNKFSYPLFKIAVEGEFESKPKQFKYDVDLEFSEAKFGSELEAQFDKKQRGDYDVDFELWGFNHRGELKAKREYLGDKSNVENSLVFDGKIFEVNGEIRHKVDPKDIKLGADLEVKLPTHSNPFEVNLIFNLNQNDLDAASKVATGGNVYLDAFLKANRDGNANGNIKVNLKGLLIINGQIKANQGAGNGDILIDAQSMKRSVKAETTFTFKRPTVNIDISFYPVFSQDPAKKIYFSTQNQVTSQNLDSKNKIDVFGQVFEGNLKGDIEGQFMNGKQVGEFDVTFPGQQYVAVKLSREFRKVNDIINAHGVASVEYRGIKNAPGAKFTIKTNLKDTNLRNGVYDFDGTFSAESSEGKNINGDLVLKRTPQGDANNAEISGKLYGSILKAPIEASYTSTYKNQAGSNKFVVSWGPEFGAKAFGKYDFHGEGAPSTTNVEIEINTPYQSLKSFKASASGSLQKPQSEGGKYEANGEFTLFVDNANPVNLQLTTSAAIDKQEGQANLDLNLNKLEPISLGGKFDRKEHQYHGEVSAKYGNKEGKAGVNVNHPNNNEGKVVITVNLPLDSHKVNVISIHGKKAPDNRHFQGEVEYSCDGKKWVFSNNLVVSEHTPSLDVKLTSPEGKLQQILLKVTKNTNKRFAGEGKLVCQQYNFLLEGGIDTNIEAVDDFGIKVSVNSPNLKLNKVVLEIHNKLNKGARRLNVNVKSDNKVLVAGSTSYTSHEENGKLIIEGSGNFKVKDQNKAATFKFIRQTLVHEKNGESGMEISFDAGLGNEAVDAELRVTNKQFRIAHSYCEEKKECAHVEIDSKLLVNEIDHFSHELEIAIDLRKLGFSHEFGLKAVTSRQGYILDHSVDVHFQSQENNKYQYSVYVHPKEAGISLSTPKRVISLEAASSYPERLSQSIDVHGEIALYLDKRNRPNEKTSLAGNLRTDKTQQTVEGSVSLSDPSLQRPMQISISINNLQDRLYEKNIVIDIFEQENQKIIIYGTGVLVGDKVGAQAKEYLEFKSEGFGVNVVYIFDASIRREPPSVKYLHSFNYNVGESKFDSRIELNAGIAHADFSAKLLNNELLKAVHDRTYPNQQEIKLSNQVSGALVVPLLQEIVVTDLKKIHMTLQRVGKNDILHAIAAYEAGKEANFEAYVLQDGATKSPIATASLGLSQSNFLKPSYEVHAETIKGILERIKVRGSEKFTSLKTLVNDWFELLIKEIDNIKALAYKTQNLQPVIDKYIKEANLIKEELLSDKNIKQLFETIQSVFATIIRTAASILGTFVEVASVIFKTIQETASSLSTSLQKELLPKLQDFSKKLIDLGKQYFDTISEIFLSVYVKIVRIFEAHQAEFQQLSAVLNQLSQEIGKLLVKFYQETYGIIQRQAQVIFKELSELPIFGEIRDFYHQNILPSLPKPEVFHKAFKNLATALKEVAPTPELKELIGLITGYIEKKLANEPVDDIAVIEQILKYTYESIKRFIIVMLKQQEVPELDSIKLPVFTKLFSRLPKVAALHFSPFAYITSNDLTSFKGILSALSLNPRDLIPPSPLHGVIAGGHHFFTFDGKHIAFPGKCNYLLVGDSSSPQHFTLAGTLKDGQLVSLTISNGADVINYKKNGQVTFNGGPAELPKRAGCISVYRDNHAIHLRSIWGLHAICSPDLSGCSVIVSGYYHGKLRGLLGNGNNEPYDDFVQPSGKITASESDFANSYKLQEKCPVVKAVEGLEQKSSPECSKLFGGDSDLVACFPLVDPANFKAACEHGVTLGNKGIQRSIVSAYVAACRARGLYITVPAKFLQCHNADKPHNYGETFTAKTPGKAADIIVIADTKIASETLYKELAQPVIQQITNELHGKGVSDVEYHVVAYGGEENRWPSHVTVGGKFAYKNKIPPLKFSPAVKEEEFKTEHEILNTLYKEIQQAIKDINLVIGNNLMEQAWYESFTYPFRAHAIKTIIAFTMDPCPTGRLLPLQILKAKLLYKTDDIIINYIVPITDLQLKDKKHTGEVVGFNNQDLFLLGKKKPEGTKDLYKDLSYNDFCVDYTLDNGGNVFSADNILHAKGPQKKQYVQTVAHNIVNSMTGVERTSKYECTRATPYTADNQLVSVLEVNDKRGETKKGKK